MSKLNAFFMLTPPHLLHSEERISVLDQLVRTLFQRNLDHADIAITREFHEYAAMLICEIYVTGISWPQFFQTVRQIKGAIEETGVSVDHIALGSAPPPYDFLRKAQGAWVDARSVPDEWLDQLRAFLRDHDAKPVSDSWFVLPFSNDAPSDENDVDYELCSPEDVARFGTRVNGSDANRGIPAGLRVRLAEGSRLQDYVSSHYGNVLGDSELLGGSNVILTTLLQMNDRLELVNHYSERLRRSERLNMYSLSSMNLHITDERDENDLSNLVAAGHLIVRDIVLGV